MESQKQPDSVSDSPAPPRPHPYRDVSHGELQNRPEPTSSRFQPTNTDHPSTSRAEEPQTNNTSSHMSENQLSETSNPAPPPLTRETLEELEIQRVIFNPRLRHDINFDPNLHLRPNDDGEKGLEKKDRTRRYWKKVERAFSNLADPSDPEETDQSLDCVKDIFQNVKEILVTLVPEKDHDLIERRFDVALLLQQVKRARLDISRFAQWLSTLLRTHCAPMRDSMVHNMVQNIENGSSSGNVSVLVEGLRGLFGVLEAMKLDIANHQVRSLMPLLINDTVNFEQQLYIHKIGAQQCDTDEILSWYRIRLNNPHPHSGVYTRRVDSNSSDMSVKSSGTQFFNVFLDTMFHPFHERTLPFAGFELDVERLKTIRIEITEYIKILVCWNFYRKNRPNNISGDDKAELERIRDLFQFREDFEPDHSQQALPISAVCSEIVRYSAQSTSAEKFNSLERSLKALPHEEEMSDQIFGEIANEFWECKDKYSKLAPGQIIASWNATESRRKMDHHNFTIHDIARRLAHIATLHWRVWSPLVYLRA